MSPTREGPVQVDDDAPVEPGAGDDLFEACVLRALGFLDAERALREAPLDRWAAAYAHLSDQLNAEGPLARASATLPLLPRAHREGAASDVDAVWGLIYGARTVRVADRLLAAFPPPRGTLVEIGAGWGPFAYAAHRRSACAEACLVDVSEARLRRAASLFFASGLPAPELRAVDVTQTVVPAAAVIAVPYALGEMLEGETMGERRERGRALVRKWLGRLVEGGRLYIIEPGTRAAARMLQEIRDQLAPEIAILGPCTGALHCPRLPDPRDWCHFTWKAPLGPVGRAIADRAHRRWQELHFSWLVLSARGSTPGPAPGAAGIDARVLELRREGRVKIRAELCTRDGVVPLAALRRHPAAYAAIAALTPGARVNLLTDGLARRGDGLRLEEPGPLVFRSPL